MGRIPDTLEAIRYRKKYRDEEIYIIVSIHNETRMPYEIFVRFDQEGHDPAKYLTEAGWDAFTRMLSGWLQHPDVFPFEKTIRQVEKASRTSKDLPGIVAEILKGYLTEEQLKAYEEKQGEP